MDETIAHYRLLDRLGEGGLGEVFRARDTKVGRTVALKTLPRGLLDKRTRRDRFLTDAAAAAALSHPNIATLFDVGEDNGRWYLAYEFVAGESLRQQMAGRPMHPRHALEIAIQIADGLAEAHARGLLHGDLRPENIVITAKGSSKLLDTGMSGWTRGGAARAKVATSSSAAEAPAIAAYMPPEQIVGGEVDGRTDIFSLGVVVREMLTGRTPAAGSTARDTVVNATARETSAAGAAVELPAELPAELDATLGRALAADPASRHQSAVSFAAELRSVAAILDVRAGESVPSSLLPLDDDAGGAGTWWVLAAVLGALGVGAWLWFR